MTSTFNDPELLASRYPKRKRVEVRYFSSDNGSDSDASTDSETECVPMNKRARTRTARSSKPLPKHKVFPFMSLPAELRNKIYEECLPDRTQNLTTEDRDNSAIWFCSKQKSYQRSVKQLISLEDQELDNMQWGRYYRPYRPTGRGRGQPNHEESEISDAEAAEKTPKRLGLNILAVCKAIYREAAPMLYSEHLVFADTGALMAFASHLSPMSARLLRHIEIRIWISTRSRKSMGFAAMAMLAAKGATNINRLHINCEIGRFWSYCWREKARQQKVPKRVARKVYRECYLWLEAVGMKKGDARAGSRCWS
ncbi:hypothetical protein K469DRAFT_746204 [Zopfia rhizophila CBS 207.26]|uniref:DUF7730 domain-containing protein n=1 Tax=Zopfia rhizophila CBS 207.26 TaxID=1314779 RepID=A0A6A6EI93_9PEZI|nr:hypothetical protein K469DRAFT_746204 [Zopfia rhizophila CBS 207.26]